MVMSFSVCVMAHQFNPQRDRLPVDCFSCSLRAALSANNCARPDFFFFLLEVFFGTPPTGEADLEVGVEIEGRIEGEVGGSGELAGVGSEIGMCASCGEAWKRLGGCGLEGLVARGDTEASVGGGSKAAGATASVTSCISLSLLDRVRRATDLAEGKDATVVGFDPFVLNAVPHIVHFPLIAFLCANVGLLGPASALVERVSCSSARLFLIRFPFAAALPGFFFL
jgi:hypothetical protein